MSVLAVVTAVHTFTAEHSDELDFQAGETIEVLEKDDAFGDGWWRGRNSRGEEGLFPATYINEPEAPSAAIAKPIDPPSPAAPSVEPAAPAVADPPSPTAPVLAAQPLRHDSPEPPIANGTTVLATAAGGLGAAAVGVSNVMGKTIGEIQNAIESITKPESDDDHELGIGQSARARLAQQAKLANDQRDRQRVSGGVAGLVYSDDSDDEEPISQPPTSLLASALPTTPPLPKPAADVDRPAVISSKPPSSWTVEEVVDWARAKGFDNSIWEKFQEHEITGDLLLELDANLLKELDIPQFGKRLRIAQAITELRRPTSIASSHSPGLSSGMSRGLSAPPVATMQPSDSSAPVDDGPYSAWSHARKTSTATSAMEPIREGEKAVNSKPASSKSGISTPASPIPQSPVTPSSAAKRESTGSLGHRRGLGSMDSKDRISSFLGRNRKPAPSTPASNGTSRLGVAPTQMHQMQPATPERSPTASAGTAAAMKQIGNPDYSGYLKKKGERYGWNTRFFVLKGNHLYWMKNQHDDKVKGHLALAGHRVIVDENTNPGSYGFRLVGADRPHYFSSAEQAVVRGWMKALMKATIARDYTVAVTSSCNIPTIPLAEAQALSPRPPSPATREATQRATRRENTSQLTAHDASILMSLDTSSGQKRRSQQISPQMPLAPDRPSRDMRRPSNIGPDSALLVDWVNQHLPPPYPKASSLPESFVSGEVIFLLVRSLSGIEPNPPVPPTAFSPESDGLPGIDGLFATMDMLIDAGVDTVGLSINDIRLGDAAAITRLLESIKAWHSQGQAH